MSTDAEACFGDPDRRLRCRLEQACRSAPGHLSSIAGRPWPGTQDDRGRDRRAGSWEGPSRFTSPVVPHREEHQADAIRRGQGRRGGILRWVHKVSCGGGP